MRTKAVKTLYIWRASLLSSSLNAFRSISGLLVTMGTRLFSYVTMDQVNTLKPSAGTNYYLIYTIELDLCTRTLT